MVGNNAFCGMENQRVVEAAGGNGIVFVGDSAPSVVDSEKAEVAWVIQVKSGGSIISAGRTGTVGDDSAYRIVVHSGKHCQMILRGLARHRTVKMQARRVGGW